MTISLEDILKDLYTISGLRISIFDADQNLVTGYPDGPSPFCGFVRDTLPDRNTLCYQQDLQAFQNMQKSKDLYIYHCHMGLLEAIAPLYCYGTLSGYLMIGQAVEDTPSGKTRVMHQITRYTDNPEEAAYFLEQLPVLSLAQMKTYARIMKVCAEYITATNTLHITPPTLAQQVLYYLTEHYSEKITMTDLCRTFFCSKTTLTKTFQTYYNQTVFEKLLEIRLEESTKLLRNSQASIHVLAGKCGFNDANYFSRIFQKHYGCTPTQYRKTFLEKTPAADIENHRNAAT